MVKYFAKAGEEDVQSCFGMAENEYVHGFAVFCGRVVVEFGADACGVVAVPNADRLDQFLRKRRSRDVLLAGDGDGIGGIRWISKDGTTGGAFKFSEYSGVLQRKSARAVCIR